MTWQTSLRKGYCENQCLMTDYCNDSSFFLWLTVSQLLGQFLVRASHSTKVTPYALQCEFSSMCVCTGCACTCVCVCVIVQREHRASKTQSQAAEL